MSLHSSAEDENIVINDDQEIYQGSTDQEINNYDIVPTHRYSSERPNRPAGVALFGSFFKFNSVSAKRTFHKTLVLCITFIAYTCFHMGRRPLSIVKNVLNRNCSGLHYVTSSNNFEEFTYMDYALTTPSPPDSNCTSWAPFDNDATANKLLAILDSAFLFSYAFFMFFSGFLADRCNLRYFLSSGMILSGLLLYAFGLAALFEIHSMKYFVTIQILAGAIQTTGWPSVVSCIANWFDRTSRGSIFGLWNSNTNLGNIMGATIAGYFVERYWGLSFIVPGFIFMCSGVIVFFFLVPKPADVGLYPSKIAGDLKNNGASSPISQDRDIEEAIGSNTDVSSRGNANRRKLDKTETDLSVTQVDETQTLINSEQSPLIANDQVDELSDSHCASLTVSFWTCLKIPGVVEYSLCLGFAKLVSYTFLYWLPRYISQSTSNNSEDSAYLSIPFDLGGMFGAILAGYLSDRYKKSGLTCTVMLILAMPAMLIYEKFAHISNVYNIYLQLLAGSLVNGPYSLITTAVSTDLGSRVKNGKALATVAAIIDGTGSIGAAIGPLFAGYVSDSGWQTVFAMLIVSDLFAALCLIRITLKELGFR